jgi:hypothetical protein
MHIAAFDIMKNEESLSILGLQPIISAMNRYNDRHNRKLTKGMNLSFVYIVSR